MNHSLTSCTWLLAVWMILIRPRLDRAGCSVGLAISRSDDRSRSEASNQASPCVGVVAVRPTAWQASVVCGWQSNIADQAGVIGQRSSPHTLLALQSR
jgi:hypothetical protein